MISTMEQIFKEDMAEYILEELSMYGCVSDEKKVTAMNVITKSLLDIRRCKAKEQLKSLTAKD